MKKNALICAVLAVVSMVSAGVANAWCFSPYIGIDAQGRHVDFDSKFGKNIFKRDYPQGNLYAGVRLCDYIGLEAGYEWSKTMHRTSSLAAGQPYLGAPVLAGLNPLQIVGTSKFDGWHANIVGFLPITEEYCADLFVSVGIVQMRASFHPTADPGDINERRVFNKTNTLARANIGVQSLIIGNLGVRLMAGWENTKRMTLTPRDNLHENISNINQRVKLKDSFNYGIGIFFTYG